MTAWIDWLSQYAFAGGLGGLFALSAVDSAGVPTGGGPDVVLALLAALRPRAAYAAGAVLAAVSGSAAGSYLLYWAGRRGGDAAARRFAPEAIRRARVHLEHHGAWVVFLSMLAPPPVPTKLFVLCAGIAASGRTAFVVATLAGRLLRYGAVAALALHYGPGFLQAARGGDVRTVVAAVAVAVALVAGALLGLRWRRRGTRQDVA